MVVPNGTQPAGGGESDDVPVQAVTVTINAGLSTPAAGPAEPANSGGIIEASESSQPLAGNPNQLSPHRCSRTSVHSNGEAWKSTPSGRSQTGSVDTREQSSRLPSGSGDHRLASGHSARVTRTTQARQTIVHSGWYRSSLASKIRATLHGKPFAAVMVTALFLALFMNDIWVLAGINSNLWLNLLLTPVMALFFIELCGLTLVDVTYLFSFFQLMDVIGTFSMVFDIPWMLGTDATKAETYSSSDNDAKRNLMLLRALRAAKIGARAGRLSRVLRFLRFLPFMGGNREETRRGIASLISGKLANLLGTRVACLTILLVMVVPIFDIYTFPQEDLSQLTWVDRLSTNMADDPPRVNDTLDELRMMVDYYDELPFGPYEACTGRAGEDDFVCDVDDQRLSSLQMGFNAPPREASVVKVYTETFMVSFNMHEPAQREAGIGICTICFIIFLMVFSGLALSSVVTELAVRPLERMLEKVQEIATTVFKFSADVTEQDEDDALVIDDSNEMKLLEKVVEKLAIIAEMQAASAGRMPEKTEDMNAEDIGVLSMMHGANIVEEKEKAQRRMTVTKKKQAAPPTVRIEDLGVTLEVYSSWGFNTLRLSQEQRRRVTEFTIVRFHETGDGFFASQEDVLTLQRFLQAVEKEYLPVPFHSFAHAADVVHGVARLMRVTGSEHFLSGLEQFSLLIAAAAHDIGHPGVNNGFLSEVGHELALEYNDRSPLENMHCAKLYKIVANPQADVFGNLTKDQYKEVRNHCIETILHTDMTMHTSMVKDLQMLYQMNMEIFSDDSPDDAQVEPVALAEIEIFTEAGAKTLVMEAFLHSADVSNPCRSWEVTQMWAWQCLEEFFMQGDQEKEKGIPLQFLNDRDKLNKPHSQIGFIEFMIAPLFAANLRLWPRLHELGDNLGNNMASWKDMWVEQTSPGEEEKAKVVARVDKVRKSLEDSMNRTPL